MSKTALVAILFFLLVIAALIYSTMEFEPILVRGLHHLPRTDELQHSLCSQP